MCRPQQKQRQCPLSGKGVTSNTVWHNWPNKINNISSRVRKTNQQMKSFIKCVYCPTDHHSMHFYWIAKFGWFTWFTQQAGCRAIIKSGSIHQSVQYVWRVWKLLLITEHLMIYSQIRCHLQFSNITCVRPSCFRHYSVRRWAVRAQRGLTTDKDHSVSLQLCGGKAGRLLSFPWMMGILQVHAVSEWRW